MEEHEMKRHMYRDNVKIGSCVKIVLKENQRSGIFTEGIVLRILTKKNYHSRGIKVQLTDGQIGRVQELVE